jgi:repressor of nif and glnA expression
MLYSRKLTPSINVDGKRVFFHRCGKICGKVGNKMEEEIKSNCWVQLLAEISKRVEANAFETWFEPTSFIGYLSTTQK